MIAIGTISVDDRRGSQFTGRLSRKNLGMLEFQPFVGQIGVAFEADAAGSTR